MEKAYKENIHVKNMYDTDGFCIFGMEGLGEFSGNGDLELFPTGRYGAMMIATKGDKVVFSTYHASTLPSTLIERDDETGEIYETATVKEGVYYIEGKNHQGKYPAFGIFTENGRDYYSIPCTRKKRDKNESYESVANGINIHTAPNDTGDKYSVGCQMLRSIDYIEFLFTTDCVLKDDEMAIFLKGKSIEDSIMFRGDNVHPNRNQTLNTDVGGVKYSKEKYGMQGPDGKYYWYIELLTKIILRKTEKATGYYVLDRTYLPTHQKRIFCL